MCCLFGLIDCENRFSARQKERILSVLATACEARGTDATGIAYLSEGRLAIYKRPLAAHRLHFHIPSDARVIMGHTRMTTQGSEKRNYNNHPFRGCAGGTPFALAHNGVLHNDHVLRRSYGLPATSIETDSFVAVQLIEQKMALNFNSLTYMAEQVEGSFTFTVLNGLGQLYFVKGDNPLCLCYFPNSKIYLYASTEEILMAALRKMRLPLEKPVRVDLACGEILRITSQGMQTKASFHAEHLYYGYWSRYTPYMHLHPRAAHREEDYLDAVKSVASSFGYTPEDIDALFMEGFSAEELEELLYCGML